MISFTKARNKTIFLDGGINTEIIDVDVQPGMIRYGQNVELADPRGYRHIDGYERIDGKIKPSDAKYTMIAGTFAGAITAGNTVTGATSGATGNVLVDYDGTDSLVVRKTSSVDFVDGEDIIGVITNITATYNSGATTADISQAWTHLARESARLEVKEIPGNGPVTGVTKLNDKIYVFRDNNSENRIYVASSTGWDAVSNPIVLKFDTGSGGDIGGTVTNGTATADVVQVERLSGSWSGGDAAGVIAIKNVSGSFSAGDHLTFAGGATATATTGDTELTRSSGGYIRSVIYNFTGSMDDKAAWVTDGVNNAIKIDQSGNIIPIYTGLTDAPEHIKAFHHHLFLSYGDNWIHSGIGDPFAPWTLISGADQWGMGDKITGACITPNGTFISFCRNRVDVVYGTSSADFTVKTYTEQYGAVENSVQVSVGPTFIGEQGLSIMTTTQKWGDFALDTVDDNILTLVEQFRESVSTSLIVPRKKEYRVYNGTNCLRMKFTSQGKLRGFTVDSYQVPVRNSCVDEHGNIYFTSDTGYLYQMDSGWNFDGDKVPVFFVLAPEHMGALRMKKRFYATVIEAESDGGISSFSVKNEFDLFNPGRLSERDFDIDLELSAGKWDKSKWNEVVWGDGRKDNYYTINDHATAAAVVTSFFSNNVDKVPYIIKLINRRFAMRGEIRQLR